MFRHKLILTCLVIVDTFYHHRFFCCCRVVQMCCRLKKIFLKNTKLYSDTENKTLFLLIHLIKFRNSLKIIFNTEIKIVDVQILKYNNVIKRNT